jgi:hypothetical protein
MSFIIYRFVVCVAIDFVCRYFMFIIDYFIDKVSRKIFKKFLCALALFPIVKSVQLPWALPLGGCPKSLGKADRVLIRDCGHSLSGVCR